MDSLIYEICSRSCHLYSRQMREIINQDGGAIIPMFANFIFARGPGVVASDKFASNWDMDGERWWERWSFA